MYMLERTAILVVRDGFAGVDRGQAMVPAFGKEPVARLRRNRPAMAKGHEPQERAFRRRQKGLQPWLETVTKLIGHVAGNPMPGGHKLIEPGKGAQGLVRPPGNDVLDRVFQQHAAPIGPRRIVKQREGRPFLPGSGNILA
jgi:hypothetical protein